MNVLFICSANKDRSKTAEDYFTEQYPEFNFDSAGTNKIICNKLGTNYVGQGQLEWADSMYVMESKHRKAIKALFGKEHAKKVKVLNIRDRYNYYDKDLLELLEDRVKLENN